MKTINELVKEAQKLVEQVDGKDYALVSLTVEARQHATNEHLVFEYRLYCHNHGAVVGLTLTEVFRKFRELLGLEVPQVEDEIIIQ